MRQNGKRQVSVYLPEEILDLYQRKYPYTMPKFLRECIKIAIENEDFLYNLS